MSRSGGEFYMAPAASCPRRDLHCWVVGEPRCRVVPELDHDVGRPRGEGLGSCHGQCIEHGRVLAVADEAELVMMLRTGMRVVWLLAA